MSDDLLERLGAIDLETAKREARAFAEVEQSQGTAPPLSRIEADVDNLRRKYDEEQIQEVIARLKGHVIDKKAEEILRSKVVKFGQDERYEDIANRAAQLEKFDGWRTGIRYFDDALMGIRPGEVTILAGVTNVGKTMVALNIVTSICTNARRNALFITLEMSLEDIEERVYNMAPIAQHGLLRQHLSIQEHRKVGLREIEIMLKSGQYDFLVIDHLQFVASLSPGRTEYEKMSYTTAAIHDLSLTYRIPIFLISHMNREATKRSGFLGLHDLKGSGSIEGDSDNVICINRDDNCLRDRQIIISLEKIRKKHVPTMYHQYKILTWEGVRLANGGAYVHFEPEGKR